MTNDTETTKEKEAPPTADRSRLAMGWYRLVQVTVATLLSSVSGIRVSGRNNLPEHGGALLVSNHVSHLDVFILGIPLHRPLNYVARSTLFLPLLGSFIRSVGGFPIQREGMGVQGLKETLRRIKKGGIVVLFPEGTRSRDGELGELKSGISVLASRARVAVVPAGIAGTFEAWPRSRAFPLPHPVRIHYGPPILPEELEGLDTEAVTALIRGRILECLDVARAGLQRDLQNDPEKTAVGRIGKLG
ncbi:1-acyl-sn-glycerol-3-phosphate acyltransferase [Singulisphaera sp. GP187]|uniref:lysophospholipid acyltransferase family protein n=1 Tax=Singulisphaera sp. GP187 TaxID=1882752 RepID=UPI0009273014|nr:lysophospholipid acyltransferase family protein [Singulisphaera sp. GP187]SIO62341.1 1-acyl-sn-glycerol-3-phosphate acyltransferase [Singulisphaera sp. GP187]